MTAGPSIDLARVVLDLLAYCEANEWAGDDPYDALNSRLFSALPFLDSRIPRLAVTQALKRSPINLRRLLLVQPTQNPKAIALFLSAVLRLPPTTAPRQEQLAGYLIDRLIALRAPDSRYSCWGYSFPWQTRTSLVPRGAPNLVCSTFVADALLNAYQRLGDRRCLAMAVSAAEYIVDHLYWTDAAGAAGFSYPVPSHRGHIHNANFLGAALLCRLYRLTGDARLVAPAMAVVRFSAGQQRRNGSWPYGEEPAQQWIDNFHTGYNLCALQSIGRDLGTREWEGTLERGFRFYRAHFFLEDGTAKYFHDRTYPIDIHCVAQSLITLVTLRNLDPDNERMVARVLDWTVRHMWDPRGFFYYRILRVGTIRTSYMRWSQAWMLLALATVLAGQRRPSQMAPFDRAAATVAAGAAVRGNRAN